MHIHSTTTCPDCQAKDEKIRRLSWSPALQMYRAAGLEDAIANLDPTKTYMVALCDIDRMKAINSATNNHVQTDRYLAAGLAVREGEIAGQMHDKGDEFVFIVDEHSLEHSAPADPERRHINSAESFVDRIARQLAGQPLLQSERYALAAAQHCHVSDAKLSATFATETGVSAGQVYAAIERLSSGVLKLKAERDSRVKVSA
jgi:GGDEF domain-containing protein